MIQISIHNLFSGQIRFDFYAQMQFHLLLNFIRPRRSKRPNLKWPSCKNEILSKEYAMTSELDTPELATVNLKTMRQAHVPDLGKQVFNL